MDDKKRCKECGELFTPKSAKQVYCDKDHFRPCPVCGNPVKVTHFSDPPRCCSIECTKERRKRTCIEKYGCTDPGNSESAKKKRRETCLARYGVSNPSQSKEIMDKHKACLKSRYGVEYASQIEGSRDKVRAAWSNKSHQEIEDINEKRRVSCQHNYGVDNPRQNEDIKQKTKDTLMKKYGVDCSLKIPEVKAKSDQTIMSRYGSHHNMVLKALERGKVTCVDKYGVEHYSMTDEFKAQYKAVCLSRYNVDNPMKSEDIQKKARDTNMKLYGVPAAFLTEESKDKARESMLKNYGKRISKHNLEFHKLLELSGIRSEFEFRIDNYWYDLMIPDRNIVIEIDPTYTHSSQPNCYGEGIDKSYHRNKTHTASLNGYRCIHIFDWDDISKIVRMLHPITRKYYARNLRCEYISNEIADKFLNNYHLQGGVRGNEICIGLLTCDEIISVMTFGVPRYNSKYDWELLRYATQFETSIIGGAKRLFTKFVKELHPSSIISYCNLSKFKGGIYETLGFKHLRNTQPAKVWSKNDKNITDNLLRQKGYDKLFKTNYGKGTNNEELMIQNGWRSVYDCGQAVYEFIN